MMLFSLLDPALVSTPEASPGAFLAANVLLGFTGLASTCTILAFVLRRLGTRAKAVTPAEMVALEQRKPRLAAAIALTAAVGPDLAAIFEALPAFIQGRPMSKPSGTAGAPAMGGPGPYEAPQPDPGAGGHGLD